MACLFLFGLIKVFVGLSRGKPIAFLVVLLVITLLIAWSGYAYFNRRKWQFVERP